MLARVAEHLYWLSRYIERAEATARLAIAASESVCCNACLQRLPWTILSCIRREHGPFWLATGPNWGEGPSPQEGGDARGRKEPAQRAPRPGSSLYIRYDYIYTLVHTKTTKT